MSAFHRSARPPIEQLQKIQEIAYLGPTAFNSQAPAHHLGKESRARERLVKHMMDGNKEKTLKAPVTAVLAFDKNWQKRFGEFAAPGRCL